MILTFFLLADALVNTITSYPGQQISCTLTGTGYAQYTNGQLLWTDNYQVIYENTCSFIVQFLLHNSESNVMLYTQAYGVYVSFYVNGTQCLSYNPNGTVKQCFQEVGYYTIEIQGTMQYNAYTPGMSFILDEQYACPNECLECVNNVCCPSTNYIFVAPTCGCLNTFVLQNSNCICPEYSRLQSLTCVCPESAEPKDSVCSCTEGYAPNITNGVLTCYIQTRESIVTSQTGQPIECSITGLSATTEISEFSSYNPIAGATFVWTSEDVTNNDYCNVTVQFLRHSSKSEITMDIYTMDAEYLYVNGLQCLDEWSSAASINSCFGEPGVYELTIQSKHTSGSYGMAFKLVETYNCPERCLECMEDTCCAYNYMVNATSFVCPEIPENIDSLCVSPENSGVFGKACVCPENSAIINSTCICPDYSELIDFACVCPENADIIDFQCVCPEYSEIVGNACECIEGYILSLPDDPFACSYIPIIPTREYVVSSKAGLEIVCDGSGVGTTVITSEYDDDNGIADADWIWTSNGEESYDYCIVTVAFFRHSNSTIRLKFDSDDTKAFYVNGEECFVDDEHFVNKDVTDCFGEVGNYDLMFSSEHTFGSFGMAFKVSESYLCPESCFDCVSDKCCPQDFIMEDTICVAPTPAIAVEEITDEMPEDVNSYEYDIVEENQEVISIDSVIVEISQSSKLQGINENDGDDGQRKSLIILAFIMIIGFTSIVSILLISNYYLKKNSDNEVGSVRHNYRRMTN